MAGSRRGFTPQQIRALNKMHADLQVRKATSNKRMAEIGASHDLAAKKSGKISAIASSGQDHAGGRTRTTGRTRGAASRLAVKGATRGNWRRNSKGQFA